MAKFEVTLKDNETGEEGKWEGEGVALVVREAQGRLKSIQRNTDGVMLLATLVKDEPWNMAAKEYTKYVKFSRMRQIKDKIRQFFNGGVEERDSEK